MSSTSILNTGLTNPMDLFIRAPNYPNSTLLASSVSGLIPIPTGCPLVKLTGTVDFSFLAGSTLATNALTTVTTGIGSEFVSKESGAIYRHIGGSTTLSVISTVAGLVHASWWTM